MRETDMLAQRSGPEFTLFGNVVNVRPAWAVASAFALVLTFIDIAPHDVVDTPTVGWYLNALVIVLGVIGVILLHELAHAAVARRIGQTPERISVYPLGGVVDDFNAPGTPRDEAIVAIAGPLASACAGGVLFGFWALLPSSTVRDDVLFLGVANLVLAIVNLLPGYPLDGGRVFRALVWYLHDDFATGTRASVTYGQIISTFGLACGLVVLGSRTSWSLAGIWIVLAAWSVARVGRNEMTRSALLSIGGSLTAGEAVHGLNPHVRAEQPLDEVLDTLLAEMNSGLGLVMADGEVIGVIALQQLRRYRRTEWPQTTAREAMIPIDQMPSLDESVPVRSLLNELAVHSSDALLVTGDSGVVGALDRHIAIEKLIDRVETARKMR